jgi:arsenate reductase
MIKIYHNPRCTKSRQGLAFLKDKNIVFEEVRYLDTGLSLEELELLIEKLDISPLELVRKNESIWKTNYKGLELSDREILEAVVAHPKLMERPVVVHNDRAVIGRPTEQIANIF